MKSGKSLFRFLLLVIVLLCSSIVFFVTPQQKDVYANTTTSINGQSVKSITSTTSSLQFSNTQVSINSTYFSWSDYATFYGEDQADLGLCWSYAGMKSLESALFLKYGEYYNFSEGWIGLARANSTSYTFGDGGNMGMLYETVKNHGVVLESDMPYDVTRGIGENSLSTLYEHYSQYAIKGIFNNLKWEYLILTSNEYTQRDIKEKILQYGWFYASIDTSNDKTNTSAFKSYQLDEETTITYLSPNFNDGGHAVTIIGWDDSIVCGSYIGAFIALNSWGASWGEGQNGIFYIPYACIGKSLDSIDYLYFDKEKNNVEIELNNNVFSSTTSNIRYTHPVINAGEHSYNALRYKKEPIRYANSYQKNIVAPGYKATDITYKIKNNNSAKISLLDVQIYHNHGNVTTDFDVEYNHNIYPNNHSTVYIHHRNNKYFTDYATGYYKVIFSIDTNSDGIVDHKETKLIYNIDYASIESVDLIYLTTDKYYVSWEFAKTGLFSQHPSISVYILNGGNLRFKASSLSTITNMRVSGHYTEKSYFNPAQVENNKVINFANKHTYVNKFMNKDTVTLTITYYKYSTNVQNTWEEATKTIDIYITDMDGIENVYNDVGFTKIFNMVDPETTIQMPTLITSKNYTGQIKLEVPTKNGYTFAGWYFDKDLTKPVPKANGINYLTPSLYKPSSPTDKSNYIKPCIDDSKDELYYMCLYPKWEIAQYSINYVIGENAQNNINNPSHYTYLDNNIVLKDPTRIGHKFLGWKTQNEIPNINNNYYYADEKVTKIHPGSIGDITLIAEWKIDEYKIIYELDGGTINKGEVGFYKYNLGAMLPTDVTKEGYTFDGWYYDNYFLGSKVETIEPYSTGTKKLYAKWIKASYSITFETYNGIINSGMINEYSYNSIVQLPTNVTKEKCVFKGWYTNPEFTGEPVVSITNTDFGTKTFYAKWAVKLDAPIIDDNYTFAYNADNHIFFPTNFDEEKMNISSNFAINIGTYTAIISLNDKDNYVWSDTLNTNDIEIQFSIIKANISTSIMATKVYNGQPISIQDINVHIDNVEMPNVHIRVNQITINDNNVNVVRINNYNNVSFDYSIDILDQFNNVVTSNFNISKKLTGTINILPQDDCAYYKNDGLADNIPYQYYIKYASNQDIDASKIDLRIEATTQILKNETNNVQIQLSHTLNQYYNNTLVSPLIESLFIQQNKSQPEFKLFVEQNGEIYQISNSSSNEDIYNKFNLYNAQDINNLYLSNKEITNPADVANNNTLIIIIIVLFVIVGLPTSILLGISARKKY